MTLCSRISRLFPAFILLLPFLTGRGMHAQSNAATMFGSFGDQSRAPVVGATIRLVQIYTEIERTSATRSAREM